MSIATEPEVVEAARWDDRPRGRRLVGPLAALAGTVAVLGYLAVVDPNQPGHYPVCPTQALFGIDCPGCGLMRGTHALVTGDVPAALDHNLLLIVFVPLVALLWLRWLRNAWRGSTPAVTREQFRRRNTLMIVGLVVLLAFGVARNLMPYLGSGIG